MLRDRNRILEITRHSGLYVVDSFFNKEDMTQYELHCEVRNIWSVHWRRADEQALGKYLARVGLPPSALNSGQLGYVSCLIFGNPLYNGSKDFSCYDDARKYFTDCCMKQGDLF